VALPRRRAGTAARSSGSTRPFLGGGTDPEPARSDQRGKRGPRPLGGLRGLHRDNCADTPRAPAVGSGAPRRPGQARTRCAESPRQTAQRTASAGPVTLAAICGGRGAPVMALHWLVFGRALRLRPTARDWPWPTGQPAQGPARTLGTKRHRRCQACRDHEVLPVRRGARPHSAEPADTGQAGRRVRGARKRPSEWPVPVREPAPAKELPATARRRPTQPADLALFLGPGIGGVGAPARTIARSLCRRHVAPPCHERLALCSDATPQAFEAWTPPGVGRRCDYEPQESSADRPWVPATTSGDSPSSCSGGSRQAAAGPERQAPAARDAPPQSIAYDTVHLCRGPVHKADQSGG